MGQKSAMHSKEPLGNNLVITILEKNPKNKTVLSETHGGSPQNL